MGSDEYLEPPVATTPWRTGLTTVLMVVIGVAFLIGSAQADLAHGLNLMALLLALGIAALAVAWQPGPLYERMGMTTWKWEHPWLLGIASALQALALVLFCVAVASWLFD